MIGSSGQTANKPASGRLYTTIQVRSNNHSSGPLVLDVFQRADGLRYAGALRRPARVSGPMLPALSAYKFHTMAEVTREFLGWP
jgi:hypothetical protein